MSEVLNDAKVSRNEVHVQVHVFPVKKQNCTRTLVGFAGVDLAEMPIVLWRRKVLNRVEVELGFKII